MKLSSAKRGKFSSHKNIFSHVIFSSTNDSFLYRFVSTEPSSASTGRPSVHSTRKPSASLLPDQLTSDSSITIALAAVDSTMAAMVAASTAAVVAVTITVIVTWAAAIVINNANSVWPAIRPFNFPTPRPLSLSLNISLLWFSYVLSSKMIFQESWNFSPFCSSFLISILNFFCRQFPSLCICKLFVCSSLFHIALFSRILSIDLYQIKLKLLIRQLTCSFLISFFCLWLSMGFSIKLVHWSGVQSASSFNLLFQTFILQLGKQLTNYYRKY